MLQNQIVFYTQSYYGLPLKLGINIIALSILKKPVALITRYKSYILFVSKCILCLSRPSLKVVKEGRILKKNQKQTRPIEGAFLS